MAFHIYEFRLCETKIASNENRKIKRITLAYVFDKMCKQV